jgi:hypothetical protein
MPSYASPFRIAASLFLVSCLIVAPLDSQQTAAPTNNDAAMHRFVSELMKKMTLEEKIGQMSQIANQQIVKTRSSRGIQARFSS